MHKKIFQKTMTMAALTVSLFAGCSTALKSGAEKVKIAKGDPAPGCNEVGVENFQYSGWSKVDSLRNEMRNYALDHGANYGRLDVVKAESNGAETHTVTFFKCP